MKGRSQRPSSSSEPDDWGDGSWTVDCVCGVNFDDGEEMVSCDECGVWVHTRCVRFVKSDSFLCDKCKGKRRRKEESEETEVAQLLAELPTKTLKFESSVANNNSVFATGFRLPTEIPIEERVHVQGIPGGDPSFFEGFPNSIFSRQLWMCRGYVPKKLNFQYREFPCWDEESSDAKAKTKDDNVSDGTAAKVAENDEKPALSDGRAVSSECEKGAAILCQVVASGEKVSVSCHGAEWQQEDANSPRKRELSRRSEGKGQKNQHYPYGSKGEKQHSHHHHSHHQGKRKKEEGGTVSRDHGKKRLKPGTDRERDRDDMIKKKGTSQDGSHSSRAHRSGTKNPKSMRNLAAQKFMDDGGSGFSKVDSNDLVSPVSMLTLLSWSSNLVGRHVILLKKLAGWHRSLTSSPK